jgi:hypothetical protein
MTNSMALDFALALRVGGCPIISDPSQPKEVFLSHLIAQQEAIERQYIFQGRLSESKHLAVLMTLTTAAQIPASSNACNC